ncbi:MAG: hypothetical protein AAGG00_02395 [Cyanobacteria bacterium P01_H01_bin.150]
MSQSNIQSKKQENILKSCVFLKLEKESQVSSHQKILPEEIEIKLTAIRFGEQIMSTSKRDKVVSFGLKRCKLILNLNNCMMPIEDMGLTAPFQKQIKLEKENKNKDDKQFDIGATFGYRMTEGTEWGEKISDIIPQVYTTGTEKNPAWVFQAVAEECLIGQITKEKLGIVKVSNNPSSLEAKLTIKGECDLHFIDTSGIFEGKNLSHGAKALLLRKFYLKYIEPRIKNYISRIQIQLSQ